MGLPTTQVTLRSAKRTRRGDCTSVLGPVWRAARRAGSRPPPWLRSRRDIASSQVVAPAPALVVFRRVRRQQPAWAPVRGRSYRRSQPSGRVRHNLRPTVADHAKVGQSGRRRHPSEVLPAERRLTARLTAGPDDSRRRRWTRLDDESCPDLGRSGTGRLEGRLTSAAVRVEVSAPAWRGDVACAQPSQLLQGGRRAQPARHPWIRRRTR
jgi:hypothetical protein